MNLIRRAAPHMLMIFTLFGLDLVFTSNQARADSKACQQIRTACKDAGFVLGGGARDGLLVDCYNPIVNGTSRPRAASIPLPTVDPQLVSACRSGNSSAPTPAAPQASAPLEPAADGQTVHDPNLNVTWLADADLASEETFGVSNINK